MVGVSATLGATPQRPFRRIEEANITINLFSAMIAKLMLRLATISALFLALLHVCTATVPPSKFAIKSLPGWTDDFGVPSLCHPRGMQATYQQALHQAGKGPCISITL